MNGLINLHLRKTSGLTNTEYLENVEILREIFDREFFPRGLTIPFQIYYKVSASSWAESRVIRPFVYSIRYRVRYLFKSLGLRTEKEVWNRVWWHCGQNVLNDTLMLSNLLLFITWPFKMIITQKWICNDRGSDWSSDDGMDTWWA